MHTINNHSVSAETTGQQQQPESHSLPLREERQRYTNSDTNAMLDLSESWKRAGEFPLPTLSEAQTPLDFISPYPQTLVRCN